MDTWWLGVRLLLLLSVANISPIVLKGMLGDQWDTPIDFGRLFVDGRPVLGTSKTWRGLAAAVLTATVAAPVLGFAPELGALAALLAMVGDAIASFTKRRFGIRPAGRPSAWTSCQKRCCRYWCCGRCWVCPGLLSWWCSSPSPSWRRRSRSCRTASG
ncbi:MAG: CDP-archaeol synthase [Frateuria sp.]|nr:CDP-archaeol synthase [Frateuria sp.]